MAQVTSGLRAVLSHPVVYSSFQALMGARKGKSSFVAEYVRPFEDMTVLDIGCGPADILAYMPGVDYWGFDISEPYIEKARQTYGDKGKFFCQLLQAKDLETLPKFDVVLATGLLHHLDDAEAIEVLQLAHRALRPRGRLVTKDPCLDPGQNPIARFLVRSDRGQNVRDKAGYVSLADGVFASLHATVRHKAWIPYTHCMMECTKSDMDV